MAELHFIRPWTLWLLLPVALLVIHLMRQQRQAEAWMQVVDSHLLKHLLVGERRKSKLQPWQLLSVIWVLSVLAMAGPSWRQQASPFTDDQAGLVILLKLSPSMEASDVQPSRLERAKFKIRDLLEAREGAASALIVYSGSAHLVMPLTKDDSIINSMAEGLSPAVMPTQGDDLAAAISAAESLLLDAGVPGSVLVVADHAERSLVASFETKKPRVPVQILSIQASQSPVDDGLAQVAKALGAELILMREDSSDVQQVSARARTNVLHLSAEDGSQGWEDAGYWLLPFILLGASFWIRKGWQ